MGDITTNNSSSENPTKKRKPIKLKFSSEKENIPKLGGVKKFKKLPKLPISTMLRPVSITRSLF